MRTMWLELVRELRWLTHSSGSVAVVAAGIVTAAAGVVSGVSSTVAAVDAFRSTLERYRANDEDIEAALGTPATVEVDGSAHLIDNPLRYDLDQAILALTQLSPAGAVSATLTLCALFVFPVAGFIVGIFVSTHDLRSGSVIARWPQAGLAAVLGSKVLAVVAVMSGLAVVTAASCVPLAWLGRGIVSGEMAELAAFEIEGPGLGRTLAIMGLSILTGAVASVCGLLVGSVTRNRTFTTAGFTVGYLLVPLLGAGDPRNLIAAAGTGSLYFPAQFTAAPIGEVTSIEAVAGIAMIGLAAGVLSILPWALRARRSS